MLKWWVRREMKREIVGSLSTNFGAELFCRGAGGMPLSFRHSSLHGNKSADMRGSDGRDDRVENNAENDYTARLLAAAARRWLLFCWVQGFFET